ncbi:MAG: pantoate--beta-alanine ligase, partial [Pseudohongiellaceae bacterium]
VNPLQFGPGEDLEAYPHTPEDDRALLTREACDALFLPGVAQMFGAATNQLPEQLTEQLAEQTRIHVPVVSEGLCGASRPGHFDGVATIVCKLLNMVRPDRAYFGLKDYQQFLVVSKLVADLKLPVTIEGVETVRDQHGLALSSRNNYLSDEQRADAALLYQCLQECAAQVKAGAREYGSLETAAIQRLRDGRIWPDYFAIRNADTLKPATPEDRRLVILAAAFVGPTRLIDNLRLELTPA